jgi:hypothetical protein
MDKLACGIVHGSQVRGQARRCVEILEELCHLIWQQAQGWVAGVTQSLQQHIAGHSIRLLARLMPNSVIR